MPGPRAVCFRTMLNLLKASPGGGWSTTCCSVERLATREVPVPFSDDVLAQSRQRLESELVEIEKELAELGAEADGSIQVSLDEGFADAAQATSERAKVLSFVEGLIKHLHDVQAANPLRHVDEAVGGLSLEHLGRLGIGNVVRLAGTPPAPLPLGALGTMAEVSAGKDSVTGHWELAGVILDRPFPTFPHGFPPEVIGPFERLIGRASLGNVVASGTEILQSL